MKTTLITLFTFLACTVMASAQEDQDKTQRQPTVVTQSQVEKDAKMAEEERKKHEEAKKAPKEDKKEADDKKTAKADANNESSAKKTSKRPGKQ
ncbi:MAG: hypothetical protein DI539_17265 [Flavobacterium psychrophilum]|nr:MAG: hypothetical protein DI539_17265 [Flavobacterium psychrophilum]